MAQFYRPQKEDRGRSRLMYITALFIIVFLLDLVAGGRLRGVVREPAGYAYIGIRGAWELALDSGIFSTRHKLELENKSLREQVAAYKALDAEYSAMKTENAQLHEMTNMAQRTPGRTASVISSLTASAYGTFTIDVGIEEGVSRGATVYTPDGFAIGVVAETGPHSALVSEIFAPDASTEALVNGTRIVLDGHGGGNARARAPRESKIEVGDVVRAPSVDAPVGVVEHLVSEATGADQELFVRIPANLQTLTLVYVDRK